MRHAEKTHQKIVYAFEKNFDNLSELPVCFETIVSENSISSGYFTQFLTWISCSQNLPQVFLIFFWSPMITSCNGENRNERSNCEQRSFKKLWNPLSSRFKVNPKEKTLYTSVKPETYAYILPNTITYLTTFYFTEYWYLSYYFFEYHYLFLPKTLGFWPIHSGFPEHT